MDVEGLKREIEEYRRKLEADKRSGAQPEESALMGLVDGLVEVIEAQERRIAALEKAFPKGNDMPVA